MMDGISICKYNFQASLNRRANACSGFLRSVYTKHYFVPHDRICEIEAFLFVTYDTIRVNTH
jgi:hypothetical protein